MILLKILHLLAMAVGVGFGLAGLVIMGVTKARGREAMGLAMPLRARLGQLSALALLLLWVTGVWMWLALHGGGLGLWFGLKLLLVIGLTVVAALLNIAGFRAARGGPRPDPVRMQRLSLIAAGLSVTIVVLAVLAFG